MTFSVYVPPHQDGAKLPVVWYLSGLTCTHANVTEKGEFRAACAELGLIFVAPDTSPRGAEIPGDPAKAYDFGLGAGFYVDATEAPFAHQLPHVELCHRRAAETRRRAFPCRYRIGNPFSAIRWADMARSPSRCAIPTATARPARSRRSSRRRRCRGAPRRWAAISATNKQAWRKHDTVALIEDGARFSGFLVDYGDADKFLTEQLRPELLQAACESAGIPLTLRRQPGYDHSYYFISTFMADHLRWHADRLKA